MAKTVMNGNDCFKNGNDCFKWQRLFQMATTVYERENCGGATGWADPRVFIPSDPSVCFTRDFFPIFSSCSLSPSRKLLGVVVSVE